MRIRSDFHDYYDCAQSHGQDQTLVYVRKKIDFPLTTELKTKKPPIPLPHLSDHRGFTRAGELPSYAKFYIVGLAGKIYPVFELVWDYADYMALKKRNIFCYSLAEIDKAITNYCNKKAQDEYNAVVFKKSKRYVHRYAMSVKRAEFEDFFTNWDLENQAIKVQVLFKQYPVWNIEARYGVPGEEWYVCYNCALKAFKFFKIKDPVAAYQEIAMFLGGLAVPQKPIPVPSDRDMVSIKGFDKFSFRKEPSKKK